VRACALGAERCDEIRRVLGACEDGSCPAVYVDELDVSAVLIQGARVRAADAPTQAGIEGDEALVTIGLDGLNVYTDHSISNTSYGRLYPLPRG
jgi:hypothetical protein